MKRREALRLVVLGGLGTAAGIWWRVNQDSDSVTEDELVDAIVETAGDLPLADGAVAAFVDAYRKNLGQLVDLAAWNIPLFHRFLLSTDALTPTRPPDEPVIYVAFYDPFVSPCFNPLG
ncbi:MAG: hypothetical protein ACI9OJ_003760 [Myxococcota bacterium]|jgi:hypothetical protein